MTYFEEVRKFQEMGSKQTHEHDKYIIRESQKL
jgi:hypothetical protein